MRALCMGISHGEPLQKPKGFRKLGECGGMTDVKVGAGIDGVKRGRKDEEEVGRYDGDGNMV